MCTAAKVGNFPWLRDSEICSLRSGKTGQRIYVYSVQDPNWNFFFIACFLLLCELTTVCGNMFRLRSERYKIFNSIKNSARTKLLSTHCSLFAHIVLWWAATVIHLLSCLYRNRLKTENDISIFSGWKLKTLIVCTSYVDFFVYAHNR